MNDYTEYTEQRYNTQTKTFDAPVKWIFAPAGRYHLIVERHENGTFQKRVYFVQPCGEYVYRLLKTKICAIDGAEGIYKNMEEWAESGTCAAFLNKILHHCFDVMKEARP